MNARPVGHMTCPPWTAMALRSKPCSSVETARRIKELAAKTGRDGLKITHVDPETLKESA